MSDTHGNPFTEAHNLLSLRMVLAPSEVVLLHGEQLVDLARWKDDTGLKKLTPALATGQMVPHRYLTRLLVAAALLAHEQAGTVRFVSRLKGAILGKMAFEQYFAERGAATPVAWPAGSIEALMAARLSEREPMMRELVSHAVGKDVSDARERILHVACEALVQRGLATATMRKTGLLSRERSYALTPVGQQLAAQTPVAPVRALLLSARARAGWWEQVLWEVEAGLDRREPGNL